MNIVDQKHLKIESDIIQIFRRNNTRGNTLHFVWNDKGLELVTYNPQNRETFLMKSFNSSGSPTTLLYDALEWIKNQHKEEHNWTVFWTDSNGAEHQSYFRGVDENEVREKFNYIENSKAKITNIRMSSIA